MMTCDVCGRPTPYSFCDRRCIRCFLFPNNIRKKDEKETCSKMISPGSLYLTNGLKIFIFSTS